MHKCVDNVTRQHSQKCSEQKKEKEKREKRKVKRNSGKNLVW